MKITLFSFFEKYYAKIIIIFSILITGLFIGIFKYIPNYSEFVIYTLGIVYAFLFFIIGIFQTVITSSFEKKYPIYKEQYQNFISLQLAIHIVYRELEKKIQKRKEKEVNSRSTISFDQFPKFYTDTIGFNRKENEPIFVDRTYIELAKWFDWFGNYISKKEWNESSILSGFSIKIYFLILKKHKNKVKSELKRIEKMFGEKLNRDLQNEKQENLDRQSLGEINSNIEYLIGELEENKLCLEDLREQLIKIYVTQANIQDQLDDILKL